jgi:hypothetical protein
VLESDVKPFVGQGPIRAVAIWPRYQHAARLRLRIYAHAIPGSERGPADAMDAMFGTIPTTVSGKSGMNVGYDATDNVVEFPQAQR